MKQIKSILPFLAIVIAAVAFYYAKSANQLVYVDVNKLIEGYKKSKTAKTEFDKKVKGMQNNVDTLLTGWQEELKKYEKERASLSANELKLKQEVLANKQQQINGYQQAIQKQIQEEDKKITQTVVNDINDYIKEFGKKKGYKMIFGASGTGNIMYADESTDLTEEVLEGLNAEYEKK